MANKLIQLTDGVDNVFPRFAVKSLKSTDNLNSLLTTGFAMWSLNADTPQNAPEQSAGALLSFCEDGWNVLQICFTYFGKIFTRYGTISSGGTFNDWRQI